MRRSASVPVLGGILTVKEREANGRPTGLRIVDEHRSIRRRCNSDVFKCEDPHVVPVAKAAAPLPENVTSAGPPEGSTLPVLGPREATPSSERSPSWRPGLRFSDQNIVRTYSLESVNRAESSTSMVTLGASEEEDMKEQDGPSKNTLLVDLLVRTLFNQKPRTAEELGGFLGPQACADIADAATDLAGRLSALQERLSSTPEGSCIAMLPSNSKLTAQHVPWIQQLAGWSAELAPPQTPPQVTPPPQASTARAHHRHNKQRGAQNGVLPGCFCGARRRVADRNE
jgi:hypothetical protein